MHRRSNSFLLGTFGFSALLSACSVSNNDVGSLQHDGGATGGVAGTPVATGGVSGSGGATGGVLGSGDATTALFCTYEGQTYAVGESFKVDCNTCTCGAFGDNLVRCTVMACSATGGSPAGTGGLSGSGGVVGTGGGAGGTTQVRDAPALDAPALDTPALTLDGPGQDSRILRLDGQYTAYPDGRRLLLVDYCLPILPIADASRYCPATLAEATALAASPPDGGPVGAPPPTLKGCKEPLVQYLPHGKALGWVEVCYYDVASGQLVAMTAGTDTPTECLQSPEPDTAAYVAQVYGQWVTC